MIKALAKQEGAIRFGHERLRRSLDLAGVVLLEEVDAYLAAYALWHGLDAAQVAQAYMRFTRSYAEDLQKYATDGLYPAQAGTIRKVDRREYDLFLIVSVLTTPHRFELMLRMMECAVPGDSALVFGVGSGLELALLQGRHAKLTACDLSVAVFVREHFSGITFVEGDFFSSERPGTFDGIYAIEVLEHVPNPYELLRRLGACLPAQGRMIATTAVNVPQFDHVYNFSDDQEFPAQAASCGLAVLESARIPHDYRLQQVDAKNMFYLLGKEARK